MRESYDVVDLNCWTRGESEPSGDETKRWFRAPDTSPYVGHWLFKPRTIKTLTLSRGRLARGERPDRLICGEDWAEKIAYELALLVGVPAVRTELATVVPLDGDTPVSGSMSLDMRRKNWEWAPGAALLAERDDEFDSRSCRGHTIPAIKDALEGMRGPVGGDFAEWPAFDVFAGYLVFDAWIGNTDRHAHNWGVLQDSATGAECLGPSFDHGTALASGSSDDYRAGLVGKGAVVDWCERGRTKRFDGGGVNALVALAISALSFASDAARAHWAARISGVDLDECCDVIAAIPNLSDPTRSFLRTVVSTNRKRLRDALR